MQEDVSSAWGYMGEPQLRGSPAFELKVPHGVFVTYWELTFAAVIATL